jgi:hypothetical protein
MLTPISYSIISFRCKAAHLHNHLSPCSGVTVPWQPGSVWTTYPYQRHENSIGWMPISFSGKRNTITIRADSCQGYSDQLEGPCRLCKALPDSVKFRDFVQQASRASDHTQWDYLSSQQLQSLLTRANKNCRQLRTQVK